MESLSKTRQPDQKAKRPPLAPIINQKENFLRKKVSSPDQKRVLMPSQTLRSVKNLEREAKQWEIILYRKRREKNEAQLKQIEAEQKASVAEQKASAADQKLEKVRRENEEAQHQAVLAEQKLEKVRRENQEAQHQASVAEQKAALAEQKAEAATREKDGLEREVEAMRKLLASQGLLAKD